VFVSVEESQKASAEVERLRAEHAKLLARWEELGMRLEEQSTAV
jgi:ATP-binding cassette, subfamily F, member 3